jgi:sporulation protein YlmC with PRC-barrel domain
MECTMSKPVILSMNILTGHKVQNPAGEDLGKIDDLVLDRRSGRVLYAVLSVGKFLGIRDRLVAVPWKSLRQKGKQKTFILNVDKETLLHAPYFDKEHWHDMSFPEWRERTETYFAGRPAGEPRVPESSQAVPEGSPQAPESSKPAGQAEEPVLTDEVKEREDQILVRRVEWELSGARAFDMSKIHIEAKDCKITLTGVVGSEAELILAENIATTVPGVSAIENNLKVPKSA